MTELEKEEIGYIYEKADQIASLARAISNASAYAPDDSNSYSGALEILASVTQQLLIDLSAVHTKQ